MERGIIQIKCTSEQRECIIDALAKEERSVYGSELIKAIENCMNNNN